MNKWMPCPQIAVGKCERLRPPELTVERMAKEILSTFNAPSVSPLPEEDDVFNGAVFTDTAFVIDTPSDIVSQKDTYFQRCNSTLVECDAFQGILSNDRLPFDQQVEAVSQLDTSDCTSRSPPSPSTYATDTSPSAQWEMLWWDHEKKVNALLDIRDEFPIDEILEQLSRIDDPRSSTIHPSHSKKRPATPDGTGEFGKELRRAQPSSSSTSTSKSTWTLPSTTSTNKVSSPGSIETAQTNKVIAPKVPRLTVTSRNKRRKIAKQGVTADNIPSSTIANILPVSTINTISSGPFGSELDSLLDTLSDAPSVSLTEQQRLALDECFSDFFQSAK